MNKKALTRKEKEKLRHREQMLDSAMKLFCLRGFHNVSMQEIAQEAEFAVGTLYNFFDSKESLYREMMNSCRQKVASMLLPVLDGRDDEKVKISKYIKMGFRIVQENAGAIKLHIQQSDALNPQPYRFGKEDRGLHDVIHTKLIKVFQSGINNGVFRNINPHVAATVLSAALHNLAFSAVEKPEQSSLRQELAALEELFFNGTLLTRDKNNA